MGFRKLFSLAFLLFFTFFAQKINGQIVFKDLPEYNFVPSDSLFFDLGPTRHFISLDGTWNVYPSGDMDKMVQVTVPSIFKGEGDLVFEKHFSLTPDQINGHKLELNFLGLNYTADISVNGVIIYRHAGGEFPFKVDLPRDILRSDKSNLLSVKLFYKLDSENTIPLKQRFYFPQNFGGILKDVYIHLLPLVSISDLTLKSDYNSSLGRAKVSIFARVDNLERKRGGDSLAALSQFSFKVKFISPGGGVIESPDYQFQLNNNKQKDISQPFDLSSPSLWSPSSPQYYIVEVELWGNGVMIDRSTKTLSIYSLVPGKESLTFNGSNFMLSGVTYVPSFGEYGNLSSYADMERDIRMIKDLGFNSVRFANSVPNPYYLRLCEKYGLLALIELPVNSLPENLAQDDDFIYRSKSFLTSYLKAYRNYSAVAAYGLGTSYLPQSEIIQFYLRSLAEVVKSSGNFLTYASFATVGSADSHAGFNIASIDNIDLYGVELFNVPLSLKDIDLKNLQKNLGVGKVFISSATYVVNTGSSNGYVNEHSFEAQAKYFEDMIDYTSNNTMAGYFINSMFDYRGDFASLTAGYNKNNIYKIGICSEDRGTDRLGYKVIYSKLHNDEKVTIPIGTKKDDAPMYFILYGLVLALFVGVLVNSGKKFREDSSRALLRPYNFYADIRDQRIMSGPHTTILAFILAAVGALLACNVLFYFRESVVFEKILLAFGSTKLISTISYLAWHPLSSLIILTVVLIAVILLLTVVVKVASFFVRTRVFYTSVYFSIIWSFLPLLLLIPVGIVLYRLLNADVANLYIYVGLAVFTVWIFYRLMKGIYVIFDVNAGSVYFYSIIFLLVVFGGILFYYQMKDSVIGCLRVVAKQYNIFG